MLKSGRDGQIATRLRSTMILAVARPLKNVRQDLHKAGIPLLLPRSTCCPSPATRRRASSGAIALLEVHQQQRHRGGCQARDPCGLAKWFGAHVAPALT